jgi:tRNA pseudouridine38-40 synthase
LPYRDKNIFLPDRFMKFFIRLSYNGAPFSGWQIQKNANSVQEELQKAFSTLLKEKIEITGAGRTDSGVNAVNYIAHTEISSSKTFSGKNPADFLYKINAILPKEIVVKNIFKMPASAHARFDAVSRTYKYYLTLEKEPFNSAFTYFYRPGSLDIEAMNKAAKYFLGEQDFTSLEKLHSGAQNSICNVTAAGWERITASTQHTAAGWEHTPANTQHTGSQRQHSGNSGTQQRSGSQRQHSSGQQRSGFYNALYNGYLRIYSNGKPLPAQYGARNGWLSARSWQRQTQTGMDCRDASPQRQMCRRILRSRQRSVPHRNTLSISD